MVHRTSRTSSPSGRSYSSSLLVVSFERHVDVELHRDVVDELTVAALGAERDKSGRRPWSSFLRQTKAARPRAASFWDTVSARRRTALDIDAILTGDGELR